jgi:hypothetical protein
VAIDLSNAMLQLTADERALIGFKLTLAELVRRARLRSRFTRRAVPGRVVWYPSRVAALEAMDASAALELFARAASAAAAQRIEAARLLSEYARHQPLEPLVSS